MRTGFFTDMGMGEYHRIKGYSRSDLVNFNRSPAYCKYKRTEPEEKRSYFELGTAAHSCILEGWSAYIKRVAVVPEAVLGKNGSKSTKAYRQWAEDNAHKTQLTEEQVEQVHGMYRSVISKKGFIKYFTGGMAETSGLWIEDFSGHSIRLKIRPDYLPTVGVAADLKTTAQPLDRWPAFAANTLAHWSAALTCRGLTRLTGVNHVEYIFGVIETTPPHDCAIFRTPRYLIEYGEYQINELLPRLAECDRTGEWPGAPDEERTLQYPAWALRDIPDEIMQQIDVYA